MRHTERVSLGRRVGRCLVAAPATKRGLPALPIATLPVVECVPPKSCLKRRGLLRLERAALGFAGPERAALGFAGYERAETGCYGQPGLRAVSAVQRYLPALHVEYVPGSCLSGRDLPARRLTRGLLAHRLAGSALAVCLLVPALAWAQAIDLSHGGPVNVTALGGIDWDQGAQTVTAHEDARAVRGTATVTADVLVAHYRKKAGAAGPGASPPGGVQKAAATAPAAAPPGAIAPTTEGDTGNNEIYRLNAEGHVHIYTQTDQAWGDHAVYDIDQSVLVLTGHGLKLTTPSDLLTARDAMEYWSAKHMAVARGDASATSNDGRRITGDVLVGYTADPNAPPAGKGAPTPPPAKKPAAAGTNPDSPGKLQRVEAYGHVKVRTQTEIVTGDRGVYLPDTGLAHVIGNVHITRGENQLNGAAAVVNMKTGLATLTQVPGTRVEGLVVPNGSPSSSPAAGGPAGPGAAAKPGKSKTSQAKPPRAKPGDSAGSAGRGSP